MAFVKIDENLPHHPKMLHAMSVQPHAFGLYVASVCYSNRYRTDGIILTAALPSLLSAIPRPKPVAAALAAARLWDEIEDAWQIHDYLEHQASSEQIARRLRTDSARKKNGSRAEGAS
jgi:hypothetical protein